MYSSYSIEKIAATNRAEAVAAAEQSRVARAFRRSRPDRSQPASPSSGTIRIPRQRRWFGLAAAAR